MVGAVAYALLAVPLAFLVFNKRFFSPLPVVIALLDDRFQRSAKAGPRSMRVPPRRRRTARRGQGKRARCRFVWSFFSLWSIERRDKRSDNSSSSFEFGERMVLTE